jgi:nucleotide-binding universal stress UspA family protein
MMFTKILLAYDGSEGANRALETGLSLAKIHGAQLWALAVEENLPRFSGTIDEVRKKNLRKPILRQNLAEARPRLRKWGRAANYSPLVPAQTIVEVAKEAIST